MAKKATAGSPGGRGPTKRTENAGGSASAATQRDRRPPVDLERALVEAFLTNERINQVLLDLLAPDIWRAQPPCSKRRNIATSFAHMHNVRCMRLKMSAREEEPPAKLDRAEVTPGDVREALGQSARAMARLIERSLARERRPRPRLPARCCRPRVRRDHARRASPRPDLSLGQPTRGPADARAATPDVGVGQALERGRRCLSSRPWAEPGAAPDRGGIPRFQGSMSRRPPRQVSWVVRPSEGFAGGGRCHVGVRGLLRS
jgi:hypothetical protein